jgi:hypothetical protein
MLVADRIIADAFDLGAHPESGAIGPCELSRLRNLSGYTPQDWTEARTQLRSAHGLLGALMGNSHPVVVAYGLFWRLYEQLETRLESKLDHVYGRRLGPALMVSRVQLKIRNWLVCQLVVAETEHLIPPYFYQGFHMLEVQNNLIWVPTVTNVPALLALCTTTLVSASSGTGGSSYTTGANRGGTGAPNPAATSDNQVRRDPGAQVRNPNRDARFVGNTPFACLVRSRSVAQAIAMAGSDPPFGDSQWSKWPALCLLACTWPMF